MRESIFLTTIIPNPVKYHGYCSRGAVTEVWEKRMAELVHKMHDAGALTDAQRDEGLHAPLVFVHGGATSRND